MWQWVTCYLSGRHTPGIYAHEGRIVLRCPYCGRHSSGWQLETPVLKHTPPPRRASAIRIGTVKPRF
jgi:hypothetical protein